MAGFAQNALAALLLLAAGGRQPAEAAVIERLETGRSDLAVFVLNGMIVGGETITLQHEIAELASNIPVAIVLNSPGGNLQEGIKLGKFFYQAKIPTFVLGFGGFCYSACSVAFLGGRDRITGKPSRFKMTGGSLGFHQFRAVRSADDQKKTYKKADIDAENKKTRTLTFALITYLKEIREDMSKLHMMLKAPSESMNLVSNEEAIALGINVMGENTADFIAASNIQERVKGD
jgi:hypothetical protein